MDDDLLGENYPRYREAGLSICAERLACRVSQSNIFLNATATITGTHITSGIAK